MTDTYFDRQREAQRVSKSESRQRGRDIGPIAPIKDLKRRESCRFDLQLFAKTYNPRAFYLEWSEIHLDAIARIQEAVLEGAMYAFAMPRGSGKTTISKTAGLWAISYAHRRYPFLIGSTGDKAIKLLDSIKIWMRFNARFVDDFPEISQAARELGGKANAASGQNCMGEPTEITWAKDEIVLPTVPCPPNLPKEYQGEWSPTSGSIIGVSGLTGEGIRGSVKTTTEGDELRPDFVLPDDPQTDQSAKSPKQNTDRYDLITGAVLGMAGPDKDISLVMPCTVIAEGDMVSRVLDRNLNPLFRGKKTKMLKSMPDDMEAWEEYFSIYQAGLLMEPPSVKEANEYYVRQQEILDAGAEPTWPERYKKNEVSAIQHAMNLYCRNPVTFFAEYQNEPLSNDGEITFLNAKQITEKQHNYGRLEVPLEVQKITAFIDVQKELLFYTVVGWASDFSGFVLDYGTFPEQKRLNFVKAKIPVTLTSRYPKHTEKSRIYQALIDFHKTLAGTEFTRKNDGARMEINRIGVDSRYQTSTVRRFVRDVKDAKVVPTMGGKYTVTTKPINHPDNQKKWTTGGRRLGPHWRQDEAKAGIQTVEIDPNFWKTFIHEGYATPLSSPGSISLFKQTPAKHNLFSEHQTAEFRVDQPEGKYGKVDVWQVRPGGPDNDLLDCMVGNAVMASFENISTIGTEPVAARSRQEVDWDSWQ